MELLQIVGWIALGFIPTYGMLEIINRKLSTKKRLHGLSVLSGGEKTI
jgi:hypothetical protein